MPEARTAVPTELFVYGTLRPALRSPMSLWLLERAEWLGAARCRGRLCDLGDYPGLITVRGARDWVVGDLLRLSDSRRTLSMLDDYEGLAPRGAYRRCRRRVVTASGSALTAWVYQLATTPRVPVLIASGDFLAARASR